MLIDEFFEKSCKTKNVFSLISLFSKAVAPFGYDRFMCFAGNGPLPDVLNQNAPAPAQGQEFYTEYTHRHYAEHDPVFLMMHTSLRPFTWDEINSLPLNQDQQKPMLLRRDCGLVKGFNIPAMRQDKNIVGLTIASTMKDARTDFDALGILFAMTNQFNMRRNELLHGDLFSPDIISAKPGDPPDPLRLVTE